MPYISFFFFFLKKGPHRAQAHKTTLTLHTLGKESHTERDTTRCCVNLSFWLVALPFVVIIFTLFVLFYIFFGAPRRSVVSFCGHFCCCLSGSWPKKCKMYLLNDSNVDVLLLRGDGLKHISHGRNVIIDVLKLNPRYLEVNLPIYSSVTVCSLGVKRSKQKCLKITQQGSSFEGGGRRSFLKFILTVTSATDVPLLALSETTTIIQERKISITHYIVDPDKNNSNKNYCKSICNRPLKCQIKSCILNLVFKFSF